MKKSLKELLRETIVVGADLIKLGCTPKQIIEGQVAYLDVEGLDIHQLPEKRELAECLFEYAIKHHEKKIKFT